ncbi:N-alpha-acetyltransferase 20-like [Corticium candelabrum]|uniref:N-alpha-acetyltransferase 20-like n=1 Tax=Corticium candelabrum TaxID=121492 RepID=UPI002E256529|nr:N-alpha-acetyltransferase 20-like [Corticium candelabrum]
MVVSRLDFAVPVLLLQLRVSIALAGDEVYMQSDCPLLEEWCAQLAPEYRRLGVAAKLMNYFEDISEKKHCFFVDLLVRVSNNIAVTMYEKLGYIVYRRVPEYYPGTKSEDAYDMRKALSRDLDKKSVIPLKEPISPDELEW